MIVPKFTIRLILLAMTVLAALSLIAKLAIDGQQWAIAVSIAIGSLVLIFGLYGLTFLLASPVILAEAATRMRQTPTTPFATNQPPPQILPPPEPE